MGRMKDFAMDVSFDLGFDGELNNEVLEEAQRRLDESDTVVGIPSQEIESVPP